MKKSAVRPLSVEAGSSLRHRRQNRMYDLDGIGGISPTVVVEPPLPTAGGGGVTFAAVAEVHMSARWTKRKS